MGKVAIIFNVTLSDAKCNAEEVEREIKGIEGISDVKIEEIGFGVRVIKALALVDNTEEANRIEEQIRKINNVSDVRAESTTLV